MSDPVARIEGVGKTYLGGAESIRALSDISFTVGRGEVIGLTGPSGCGKSTLLNIIGCVDIPTSGSVIIGGRATDKLNDDELTKLRRESIGTVFQAFNLLPTLTLAENVALPLRLLGRSKTDIAELVDAALLRLGIGDRAKALPGDCSGGQQQRAAIARAVIHRPVVLLADEPTGNLDSQNGMTVLELLRELAAGGQSIVIATHSVEAAAICDRVIEMRDGTIVNERVARGSLL